MSNKNTANCPMSVRYPSAVLTDSLRSDSKYLEKASAQGSFFHKEGVRHLVLRKAAAQHSESPHVHEREFTQTPCFFAKPHSGACVTHGCSVWISAPRRGAFNTGGCVHIRRTQCETRLPDTCFVRKKRVPLRTGTKISRRNVFTAFVRNLFSSIQRAVFLCGVQRDS